MQAKKRVTVYFQEQDLIDFKSACKKNDVTMAAKLLDMAKAYTKKECKAWKTQGKDVSTNAGAEGLAKPTVRALNAD